MIGRLQVVWVVVGLIFLAGSLPLDDVSMAKWMTLEALSGLVAMTPEHSSRKHRIHARSRVATQTTTHNGRKWRECLAGVLKKMVGTWGLEPQTSTVSR